MKSLLIKLLKIFLFITLILLIVLVVFGLVLTMGWPWWVGGFIIAGIAGLILIFLFIRRFLLRRREKNFVDQVIAQDEASLKQVDIGEAERLRDLQARWKEAVDALKSSHLKQYGNPLYVLPWYLVIGESGSGKTTAIKNAGLSSPFVEVSRTSGLSGTRNCDWWFFEQAVLLDTAGRYAVPVDEGRDRDEWHQFLSLLAKFRKKEPLNGLVITIAADKLFQSEAEQLEETGRSIRKRIDELMRILGTKFPVYILITKCDLIQGMAPFCDRLDENALQQAMGAINPDRVTDVSTFVSHTISSIAERLRDLRLILLHKSSSTGQAPVSSGGTDPSLILFPDEFEQIETGLTAFMKGTFQPNPYQETPILRGLYFSSGRQEGTPYSHFLKALGVIDAGDVLPGTDRGLFLHHLFTRILPQDRRLFVPTTRTIRWGRLTRNIGLTAFVTVMISLCGLLSFSFVKNLQIIRGIPAEFSKPPVLTGQLLTDLSQMDRFRQTILDIEKQNNGWWLPRFGLNESKEVETRFKNAYCRAFSESLSAGYDLRLEDTLTGFAKQIPDKLVGRYSAHLARRINLIKARLNGEGFNALQSRVRPLYDPDLVMADAALQSEITSQFNVLNDQYLVWQGQTDILSKEMQRLQSWLKYILATKPDNINWLVAWANIQPELAYITLQDFWGDRLLNPDNITIPPAFTVEGKKQIDHLISEIETALPDPTAFTDKKPDFNQWYPAAYIKIWNDFTTAFPKGEYWLADKTAWQQVATRITTDQSPYFAFIDTLAAQLSALDREKEQIPWIYLVRGFQAAKTRADDDKSAKKLGMIAKATRKGKKLLNKIEKIEKKANKIGVGNSIESRIVAAKSYQTYRKALSDIALAAESRKVSYQLTVDYFKDDPATSESPFFIAHKALKKLQNALETDHPVYQKLFWDLASGPLYFMRDYVNLETACYLNSLWEKDVLFEIQGIRDKTRVYDLLFGSDGYVIKFINGPAAPFLSRNLEKGIFARLSLGRRLPFKPDFLDYITHGIEMIKRKQAIDLDNGLGASLETAGDTEALLELLFLRDDQKVPIKPMETASPEPEPPPPLVLKDKYVVSIKGLPTDVNAGARIEPHSTTLSLRCGDRLTRLTNMNFPVKKTFIWVPEICTDVTLKIEIGSQVLTKKFTGQLAFPKFFNAFPDGKRTFSIDEFSEKTDILKHQGIKYIKVNYQFDGHQPILAIITDKEKRDRKKKEALRIAAAARNASQARDARQKAAQSRNPMNIKDILAQWEAKQALKELKDRQARNRLKKQKKLLAQKVKQAWEARIPDVPRDIVTCWDH
jgi:type VI secretion system protein ImpL